ncbi:MAG: hypothetical protein K2I75_05345, partial [Clostridiales bacterium]|nr:hypothetical protein [Clostridiales bacterium]
MMINLKCNIKKIFSTILIFCVMVTFMACTDKTNKPDKETPPQGGTEIIITVGDTSFSAALENNETANAFKQRLPLTLDMSELNGNEKYHYLSDNLPSNPSRVGTIRNGDIMLYGSNCVVLFYETFSSSYSYTRIGRVNDTDFFKSALGRSVVTV